MLDEDSPLVSFFAVPSPAPACWWLRSGGLFDEGYWSGAKVTGLFDRSTYVSCWYEKVNKNGSKGWRIVNQFVRREETLHHHLSCATIQSRECSPHLELILHSCLFWKRVLQSPSSCKKAESMACAWQHTGKKGPVLHSSASHCTWGNTHRWAMGRGRGRRGAAWPRRLRTQTHGGESDCSTSPVSSLETFLRYLRNLRMLHINSCATPIFRAAMGVRYIVYKKHVLIL